MLIATILISLLVGMLFLAVIALSRDVEQVRRESSAPQAPAWPLGVSPGFALDGPDAPPLPDTCFVVLAPIVRHAYPTVVAAGYVAARWGHALVVVSLNSPERAVDLEEAIRQFDAECLQASDAFFDALELQATPAVVFIRRRRVQEALAAPSSPAEIAEHFTAVAGPLVAQNPLQVHKDEVR